MNILFIVGAAEPGKNGVGDYARRLAGELEVLGHTASMVSVNDGRIQEAREEKQMEGGSEISVLRLPKKLPYSAKGDQFKSWIGASSIDWVSIQFVPHAYHDKGFYRQFLRFIAPITAPYKVHLMVHELWEGMNREAKWQQKIKGAIQRNLFKLLVKRTAPDAIHVQSSTYASVLKQIGVSADRLPLFSNIPVLYSNTGKHAGGLNFVVFGTIFQDNHFHSFLDEVTNFAATTNTEVSFTFVGRGGETKQGILNAIQEHGQEYNLTIADHGEQDADIISKVLAEGHIGLTTTPYALIDKSGVVAAYLGHGLSTLCIGGTWSPPKGVSTSESTGVEMYQPNRLAGQIARLSTLKPQGYDIRSVANQLVNDLTSYHG